MPAVTVGIWLWPAAGGAPALLRGQWDLSLAGKLSPFFKEVLYSLLLVLAPGDVICNDRYTRVSRYEK